jgi:uncharacterized membrane protein
MAHTHPNAAGKSADAPQLLVDRTIRRMLAGLLLLCAVVTIAGVVLLWPTGHDSAAGSEQFLAAGTSIEAARVTGTQPSACDTGGESSSSAAGAAKAAAQNCALVSAVVTGGRHRGDATTVETGPEVGQAGLRTGDTIQLLRTPSEGTSGADYTFFDFERKLPLWVLAVAFAAVVILVGRLRGLLALVALGFAAVVLVKFMIPSLLEGESSIGVGLAGSAAIMFVVLYLAHGMSTRTSTALAGTLLGLLITAGVGALAVHEARLTGLSSDENALLSSVSGQINLHGLVTCGLIVAGLGVLNDVTITQSSAVWELRAAAPDLGPAALFTSAMRIGRDHIASSVYTIVFAYAGAALPVLMLLEIYRRPIGDVLVSEDIAEEIVRTLSSAIGLVLAVPLTTAIAVVCASSAAVLWQVPDEAVIEDVHGGT